MVNIYNKDDYIMSFFNEKFTLKRPKKYAINMRVFNQKYTFMIFQNKFPMFSKYVFNFKKNKILKKIFYFHETNSKK